jgi:hypothetical protein
MIPWKKMKNWGSEMPFPALSGTELKNLASKKLLHNSVWMTWCNYLAMEKAHVFKQNIRAGPASSTSSVSEISPSHTVEMLVKITTPISWSTH